MASWESEKVTKTLMEYMVTRARMSPPVQISVASEAPPMSRTPSCMVSRSESWAKRCGSQESWAMLDMTRGPSMKPAWAATKSSRASETSVTTTKAWPAGRPKGVQPEAKRSSRTAFMVFPSSGAAWKSR